MSQGPAPGREPVGPVGPVGSISPVGPVGSVAAGPARSGGPPTGTAVVTRADTEIKSRRDARKPRDGQSRDQNHGLHPERRGLVGGAARHTRPMTRAFPVVASALNPL